jgi:hypothetical protein
LGSDERFFVVEVLVVVSLGTHVHRGEIRIVQIVVVDVDRIIVSVHEH